MLAIQITTVKEKDHTHEKKADSYSSNVTSLHFSLHFHSILIKLNGMQRNVYFLNQMGLFFPSYRIFVAVFLQNLSKHVCLTGQAH